jgi:hypothetical protein
MAAGGVLDREFMNECTRRARLLCESIAPPPRPCSRRPGQRSAPCPLPAASTRTAAGLPACAGRIQGPLRMVFVRDRSAEDREDAITGALHDVAVISSHRVDHQLQSKIDDRPRLFGSRSCSSSVEPLMSANSAVTVFGSPSRLSVSIEGSGATGFVFGCCAPRQKARRIGRRICRESLFEAAGGALRFERRAAFVAELETVRVFSVAFRTAHRL